MENNKTDLQPISLDEVFKILNIEEYKERILNSNSHGETFHLVDYIIIAQEIRDKPEKIAEFKVFFENVVAFANENWARPESVFQHILSICNGK